MDEYLSDLFVRFRWVYRLADVTALEIHDLCHFATAKLFIESVADNIISKMTDHRSQELDRNKHFSPQFLKETSGRIAGKAYRGAGRYKLGYSSGK
jgi:hypothetical protein